MKTYTNPIVLLGLALLLGASMSFAGYMGYRGRELSHHHYYQLQRMWEEHESLHPLLREVMEDERLTRGELDDLLAAQQVAQDALDRRKEREKLQPIFDDIQRRSGVIPNADLAATVVEVPVYEPRVIEVCATAYCLQFEEDGPLRGFVEEHKLDAAIADWQRSTRDKIESSLHNVTVRLPQHEHWRCWRASAFARFGAGLGTNDKLSEEEWSLCVAISSQIGNRLVQASVADAKRKQAIDTLSSQCSSLQKLREASYNPLQRVVEPVTGCPAEAAAAEATTAATEPGSRCEPLTYPPPEFGRSRRSALVLPNPFRFRSTGVVRTFSRF